MPLIEMDGPHAAAYLAARENCRPGDLRVTALGGGVSNHVLLVESPSRRYVLKQSLEKLRVERDWRSRRDRVWREADALRLLAPLLPPGSVPQLLYEDRANFLFAMSAIAGEHTWKSTLLNGDIRNEHAAQAARIHAALLSAQAAGFDSQDVFDELRLDPYYRFTASRHPKLAHYFHAAIARCGEQRCALVHGDWSPKNMIVDGPRLTAIDFEVIHFGDPSFDSAFLLNHLLLKSFHQPQHAPRLLEAARTYWDGIRPVMDLNEGTLLHLPLLLLARVDGKSPAEYIREEAVKKRVREFALELLHSSGARVEDALAGRSWSGLN